MRSHVKAESEANVPEMCCLCCHGWCQGIIYNLILMFLIPQEDFNAFIHCEGFKFFGCNFSNMQKFHYLLLQLLITQWILRCRNCHCPIFYTSKILCLELHMEFYKVAGDFFVWILGCRNCHCPIFYTSKILCLELTWNLIR